ncbi:MAG: PH domain-containing protein, partial [Planctomycetales bacterium]
MSENLDFECPHCSRVVAVSGDALGGTIRCPHCERDFQAKAPLGRQVGAAAGDRARPAESRAAEERTLRQLHPVVFRNHVFLSGLFALLTVCGLAAVSLSLLGRVALGLEGTALLVIGAAALLAAVGFFLYQWLHAVATRITVTTERIIVTRGIVTKRTNELQHDDVRNIRCDQNVFERLFNYGDIALSSSGQDDMEIVVHDIPDPQGVVEIVR